MSPLFMPLKRGALDRRAFRRRQWAAWAYSVAWLGGLVYLWATAGENPKWLMVVGNIVLFVMMPTMDDLTERYDSYKERMDDKAEKRMNDAS